MQLFPTPVGHVLVPSQTAQTSDTQTLPEATHSVPPAVHAIAEQELSVPWTQASLEAQVLQSKDVQTPLMQFVPATVLQFVAAVVSLVHNAHIPETQIPVESHTSVPAPVQGVTAQAPVPDMHDSLAVVHAVAAPDVALQTVQTPLSQNCPAVGH